MTMITVHLRHAAATKPRHPSSTAPITRILGEIVTRLLDWQERARARRQLLALGDGALKDFGCTRADAVREGDKPFWRA